jgi:hypothetical protein
LGRSHLTADACSADVGRGDFDQLFRRKHLDHADNLSLNQMTAGGT